MLERAMMAGGIILAGLVAICFVIGAFMLGFKAYDYFTYTKGKEWVGYGAYLLIVLLSISIAPATVYVIFGE